MLYYKCHAAQALTHKVGPNAERCDIVGKKYAQTLRGATMTCQNRKELGLVLEKWRSPIDFGHV